MSEQSTTPSSGIDVEPVVFGTVGRVFIVRWRGPLTGEAMQRTYDAMFAARREVGAPLVNLSVLPVDSLGIPEGYRERIQERYSVLRHLCEAIYIVMPGTGLGARLVRGASAIQSLIAGIPIEAAETAEEAVAKIARRVHAEPAALLAEARRRGLLR